MQTDLNQADRQPYLSRYRSWKLVVAMLGFEGIEKLKTKELFYTATGELVSHLKTIKDGYLPRIAIFGLIIAVGLLLVAAQRYIANKRLKNNRWNNGAP